MFPLETKVIFQAPIFHFHDYGRKGILYSGVSPAHWNIPLNLYQQAIKGFLSQKALGAIAWHVL